VVRAVVLLLILAFPAGAWELTIAFTNDLHVALERLPGIAPILSQADLVLDAGDAWEDLYRLTGLREALQGDMQVIGESDGELPCPGREGQDQKENDSPHHQESSPPLIIKVAQAGWSRNRQPQKSSLPRLP